MVAVGDKCPKCLTGLIILDSDDDVKCINCCYTISISNRPSYRKSNWDRQVHKLGNQMFVGDSLEDN